MPRFPQYAFTPQASQKTNHPIQSNPSILVRSAEAGGADKSGVEAVWTILYQPVASCRTETNYTNCCHVKYPGPSSRDETRRAMGPTRDNSRVRKTASRLIGFRSMNYTMGLFSGSRQPLSFHQYSGGWRLASYT